LSCSPSDSPFRQVADDKSHESASVVCSSSVDPEIIRTTAAYMSRNAGQAERKSRSDRSQIETDPVICEQHREQPGSMKMSSPAESETSRSPTTNVRLPISDTPSVQASRSTIEHVLMPSTPRAPMPATPVTHTRPGQRVEEYVGEGCELESATDTSERNMPEVSHGIPVVPATTKSDGGLLAEQTPSVQAHRNT
jgi:hypothetical protein